VQIGLVRVGIARNSDSCRTRICVNTSHKYALDFIFMFSRTRAFGLVLGLMYVWTWPKRLTVESEQQRNKDPAKQTVLCHCSQILLRHTILIRGRICMPRAASVIDLGWSMFGLLFCLLP